MNRDRKPTYWAGVALGIVLAALAVSVPIAALAAVWRLIWWAVAA